MRFGSSQLFVIVLLALLAGLSFWLQRAVAPVETVNDGKMRHDPDAIAENFLVRQFDAFVWRPMGLDRHPELRDMYFGNYTKLVYQAQTNDPNLDAKAQVCADRLGLAFERRFTGYGDLATALQALP